jgi:Zn-dependent peptidase ImmA (M78 family)
MAPRPNPTTQADALLEQHWDGTLPVPVARIANELGVALRYELLEGDLSGMLYRAEDGAVVLGVNSWHAEVRQRFTIAHELGHLALHAETLYVDGFVARDTQSSLAIKPEEIDANAFAAELLMPRNAVLEQLSKLIGDSADLTLKRAVAELARIFDVSEQAMQFRLVNLGLSTTF